MASVSLGRGFPVYSEGVSVCMDVDTGNPDPVYWDQVLKSFDLGMSRGKHLKSKTRNGMENRDLISVGGTAELDAIDAKQRQLKTGKVSPSGHGPDD